MSLVPDDSLWIDCSLRICIEAYSFGDRFAVPAFSRASNNVSAQNEPTVHYFGYGGKQLPIYAFKNIPSDRVILQHLVDWYSQTWDVRFSQFNAYELAQLPLSFLRRVMQRLHELQTMTARERFKKRCYYKDLGRSQR
jgi:hypothetical protein